MAKILVIDDNAPLLDMLRLVLRAEGHEVGTAADGPAGLRLAESTRFDLALIDVDMPGLDGIAVCKSLRDNPATRNMRVLMMTGRPGLEVDVRSRCAGAAVVLSKPFLGSAVIEEIARFAGMASAHPDGGGENGHERDKKSRARRTLA
ncbi:MAG: response regulator [Opitutaceae bacterium]|jgi:DNA-binding response OmpR family regulator